jgi:hypothetical protein
VRLPFGKTSYRCCPSRKKPRSQGLATLSAAYVSSSLEAYFSSQRSWVSPFRALTSLSVVETTFPSPLFALALFYITSSAMHRRFSAFIPPRKPNPLLLPGGLVQVGIVCSLGLCSLPGTLSPRTAQRSSPSLNSPRILIHSPPRSGEIHGSQGLTYQEDWLSPYGAPTCLAFLADCHHHLFEKVTRCGLFFHLGELKYLTILQ